MSKIAFVCIGYVSQFHMGYKFQLCQLHSSNLYTIIFNYKYKNILFPAFSFDSNAHCCDTCKPKIFSNILLRNKNKNIQILQI